MCSRASPGILFFFEVSSRIIENLKTPRRVDIQIFFLVSRLAGFFFFIHQIFLLISSS